MSRYELGRLFFDACRDRETKLVARYRADPKAVLVDYDLTDTEREAVLNGDIRAVYEAGVPPLLVRMGASALFGRIDTPTYRQVLTGAVQATD